MSLIFPVTSIRGKGLQMYFSDAQNHPIGKVTIQNFSTTDKSLTGQRARDVRVCHHIPMGSTCTMELLDKPLKL